MRSQRIILLFLLKLKKKNRTPTRALPVSSVQYFSRTCQNGEKKHNTAQPSTSKISTLIGGLLTLSERKNLFQCAVRAKTTFLNMVWFFLSLSRAAYNVYFHRTITRTIYISIKHRHNIYRR